MKPLLRLFGKGIFLLIGQKNEFSIPVRKYHLAYPWKIDDIDRKIRKKN